VLPERRMLAADDGVGHAGRKASTVLSAARGRPVVLGGALRRRIRSAADIVTPIDIPEAFERSEIAIPLRSTLAINSTWGERMRKSRPGTPIRYEISYCNFEPLASVGGAEMATEPENQSLSPSS
jgi:hypothetical protein